MTAAFAQEVLDCIYDDNNLSWAAEYIAIDGSPAIPFRLLLDQGDGQYGAQGLQLIADRNLFRARLSELAAPKRGDWIRVTDTGTTYEINAKPRRDDVEQLEWTLELVEVSG